MRNWLLIFLLCTATPAISGLFGPDMLFEDNVKDLTVQQVWQKISRSGPIGIGNASAVIATSTWETGRQYQKFMTYYVPGSDTGYDSRAVNGIENYCKQRGGLMETREKRIGLNRFDCMAGETFLFAAFFGKGPTIAINGVTRGTGTFAVTVLIEPLQAGKGNNPLEEFNYADIRVEENYHGRGSIRIPSLVYGAR